MAIVKQGAFGLSLTIGDATFARWLAREYQRLGRPVQNGILERTPRNAGQCRDTREKTLAGSQQSAACVNVARGRAGKEREAHVAGTRQHGVRPQGNFGVAGTAADLDESLLGGKRQVPRRFRDSDPAFAEATYL